MKHSLARLLFALFLLTGLSCQAADQEFTELTARELKQLMDSGEKFMLLNGLSDIMFNQGFIPGSINVELDDIATSALLPEDNNTLIVTYCLGRT